MLGWFTLGEVPNGTANRMLKALAGQMAADGLRVAGAVQDNIGENPDCACDMDLSILGHDGPPIRISQSLGRAARGCRLDPGALEQAAALIAARIEAEDHDLLVLTKFGKQEALGRGFRQVIAQAIEADLPVILHVAPENRAAFDAFAGDLAQQIAPDALTDWCRSATGRAA